MICLLSWMINLVLRLKMIWKIFQTQLEKLIRWLHFWKKVTTNSTQIMKDLKSFLYFTKLKWCIWYCFRIWKTKKVSKRRFKDSIILKLPTNMNVNLFITIFSQWWTIQINVRSRRDSRFMWPTRKSIELIAQDL